MHKSQRERPATVELKPGSISIKWLESNETGSCVICAGEVGFGPVGRLRASRNTNVPGTSDAPRAANKESPDGAICDQCLLDHHLHLGLLMAFVNAGRELAKKVQENPSEAERQKSALMIFASIYDLSSRWPRRPIVVYEFLSDLIARLLKQAAQVPRDVLGKLLDGPKH